MRRFWKTPAALIVLLLTACSVAQEIEIENVPDEVLNDIQLGAFARAYTLNGSMNPFYLRGDFDGDGKPDYAFWIKARSTGAVGIAIWLAAKKSLIILGAGHAFRVGSTSETKLDFLNTWKVFGKEPVERGVGAAHPPRLLGDAILVGKGESASGLIYWNGKEFAWYQQGD